MFVNAIGSLDLAFFSLSPHPSPQPSASTPRGRLWLRGAIHRRGPLEEVVGRDAGSIDLPSLLLAALERAGTRVLAGLPGAFAGAWQEGDRVTLFRDSMGIEPLHFRQWQNGLHVHSDALPLARLSGRPLLDEDWLATYLLLAPEEPAPTPFEGVSRVPPGHVVHVDRGVAPRIERYWNPSFEPLDIDFATAVATGGEMLDAAMQPFLGAPLMLSAGVDSVAMASRLHRSGALRDAITGSPSVHADPVAGAVGDEYPLAHLAYQCLEGNGEHHRLQAAPSGLAEAIGWAFDAFQRPVYNPANLGWVDGCQALASGLGATELLEGTIGNFTLGHDGEHPMVALAAARNWRAFGREAVQRRGRGVRLSWREAPPDWWVRLAAPASARARARTGFLDGRYPAVRRGRERAVARGIRIDRPVDGYAYPERRLRDIILQLDLAPPRRAALRRHGIDLVDPYADPGLVEFSLRLPDALYRQGRDGRRVQRALLDPRLPEVMLQGRVNGLQGTDWRSAAMRDAGLMRRVIGRLRDGHRGAGIFDVETIDRVFRRWPAAGWNDRQQIMTYRIHLTRALTGAAFAQWVEEL